MNTRLLTFLFVLFADIAFAQTVAQTVTIEECFEKAKANYPLIKQQNLIEQSKNYEISNLSKTLLPQAVFNAQASYQSDVVSLPVDFPGVPKLAKDNYKATVDISQTVWDGGIAKAQKELAKLSGNVEIQSIEVEIYPLREQVNNLYLGVLMIEEQLKQLDILQENLETGLKTAEALQKNGVAIASDIDILKVEILNTGQRKTEAVHLKDAYIEMLSALTGVKFSAAMLQKPEVIFDADLDKGGINRPETVLFLRQSELLDAQRNLIKAKNLPKLNIFAQGGYGKPGLNMLSSSFEFFGLGGIRMSWNIGNLYTKNNEKRIININQEKIKNREETLIFNINRQLIQLRKEMESLKNLMKSDDEIIIFREQVRLASEKKYNNGIYTVNDLIKDINAENLARRSKAMHEMQFLMSVYKFKNIKNI